MAAAGISGRMERRFVVQLISPANTNVYSSIAIASGVAYVGSRDHNLYALNARTGAPLWSYATGNYVTSSPAVVNGVLYVGSWDHSVYAFSLHQ